VGIFRISRNRTDLLELKRQIDEGNNFVTLYVRSDWNNVQEIICLYDCALENEKSNKILKILVLVSLFRKETHLQ
jgi:hypothetical protein